jgi:hypothetical protein
MQFDRRRRHNLLICGANERMAENLANLCLFTALLNTNADVLCMDGETLIGDDRSSALYDCLSGFSPRFRTAKSRQEIIELVNVAHSAYTGRKKAQDDRQTLVVIKNFQLLDIIKKMFKGERVEEGDSTVDAGVSEDLPFSFSTPKDAGAPRTITEKMLQLVEDGSNYGVFFVVSSLEYQAIKENMHYGENVLSKFPERIIFSLGNNDSDYLIDGVSVSGLRDNTVYFSDGVKTAFQFKPYTMPEVPELAEFIKSLSWNGDAS